MRIQAGLGFCLIALLSATQAFGGDLLVNVQNTVSTALQDTGPGSVIFYGVNPLRYKTLLKVDPTYSPAPQPPGIPPPAPRLPCLPNLGNNAAIFGVENDLNIAASDIDTKLGGITATSWSTLQTELTQVVQAMNDRSSKESIAAEHLQCLQSSESMFKSQDQQTDINALLTYSPILAQPLRVSQFSSKESVSCSGLHGGSSVTKFTLTLNPITPPKLKLPNSPALLPPSNDGAQVSDASLSCLGSVAVSGGFLFSSLSNKTFTAINSNLSLPSPSPGATQPPARVGSSSSALVYPAAFVHVAPWSCGDICPFLSFGSAISSSTGSSSSSTALNFALGGSVSIYRYVFITLGANLANVVQPAPGYSVGSPIAANAMVPTTSKSQAGLFLAVTFGGSPGATKTTSNPTGTSTGQSATPAKK